MVQNNEGKMNISTGELYGKEKMNFILSIFFLLTFSLISVGQIEYMNQQFKTNILIGNPDIAARNKEVLYLEKAENKEPWGNFIQLNADRTFQSYTQNICGNDCRVKIKGEYSINGNTITFLVREMKYMDICATQAPLRNVTTFGKYIFTTENDQLVLNKMD